MELSLWEESGCKDQHKRASVCSVTLSVSIGGDFRKWQTHHNQRAITVLLTTTKSQCHNNPLVFLTHIPRVGLIQAGPSWARPCLSLFWGQQATWDLSFSTISVEGQGEHRMLKDEVWNVHVATATLFSSVKSRGQTQRPRGVMCTPPMEGTGEAEMFVGQ